MSEMHRGSFTNWLAAWCCALATLFCMSAANAANSNWSATGYRGEEKKAVQGCANTRGEEDWVCVFVRCDRPGEVGLLISAPGPDVFGKVTLDIDGQAFPFSFKSDRSTKIDFANRAEVVPEGFWSKLKTGKLLTIKGAGLKSGYDRIALTGAQREVEKIESVCGVALPAAPAAPAPTASKEGIGAPTAAAPPASVQATPAEQQAVAVSIAEAENTCKSRLDRAPKDLLLGEIDKFCRCMGVQETAMQLGRMNDNDKDALRASLSAACVGIVRGVPPTAAAPPAAVVPPVATAQQLSTPPVSSPPSSSASGAVSGPAGSPQGDTVAGLWGLSPGDCNKATDPSAKPPAEWIFVRDANVSMPGAQCRSEDGATVTQGVTNKAFVCKGAVAGSVKLSILRNPQGASLQIGDKAPRALTYCSDQEPKQAVDARKGDNVTMKEIQGDYGESPSTCSAARDPDKKERLLIEYKLAKMTGSNLSFYESTCKYNLSSPIVMGRKYAGICYDQGDNIKAGIVFNLLDGRLWIDLIGFGAGRRVKC